MVVFLSGSSSFSNHIICTKSSNARCQKNKCPPWNHDDAIESRTETISKLILPFNINMYLLCKANNVLSVGLDK